jgi:heat shock protein HtpX
MVGTGLRTAALFGAIIALFVVVGGLLGEYVFGTFFGGLITALVLSVAFNFISYFLADRFVLWANNAKIVPESEYPRLARIVQDLAPKFGLVAPRIAIVPTATPNAFATGRDERHSVVAATEGILQLLNDRELTGVLAHELAHVKDRDVLLMTFAATIAGAISYLAQFVIFSAMFGGSNNRSNVNPIVLIAAAITAPFAAMLLQLAISRSRELRADEVGATTLGDPEALARALEKLEVGNLRVPLRTGSPASSSLYIVNPYRGSWFASLFSTHPPIEERIQRLRSMHLSYRYAPNVGSPRFASSARGSGIRP